MSNLSSLQMLLIISRVFYSVCLSSTSSNEALIKAFKYTPIAVIWWALIVCGVETNFLAALKYTLPFNSSASFRVSPTLTY